MIENDAKVTLQEIKWTTTERERKREAEELCDTFASHKSMHNRHITKRDILFFN